MSVSRNENIIIWDLNTLQIKHKIEEHNVLAADMSGNGQIIIICKIAIFDSTF